MRMEADDDDVNICLKWIFHVNMDVYMYVYIPIYFHKTEKII